jgi:hypothetical protein
VAGTFPVRLKPEDWQSGSVNWLLDVIAPDRKTAGRVIANFARGCEDGRSAAAPADRRAGGEGAAGEDGWDAWTCRRRGVTTVDMVADLWFSNGLRVGVRDLVRIDARGHSGFGHDRRTGNSGTGEKKWSGEL